LRKGLRCAGNGTRSRKNSDGGTFAILPPDDRPLTACCFVADSPHWSMRTVIGDDAVSVVLAGGIDGVAAVELIGELLAIIDGYSAPVVLDLGQVLYLDSHGLRALLVAGRQAAVVGSSLTIIRASPAARRVLEISGTGPLFALDPLTP